MDQGIERSDHSEAIDLESGLEALRQSPEFRGPVEPLENHEHSNGHLALIYEDRSEQFAAAIPFIQQGLDRGERCLYVANENTREEVLAAMEARGIDVDAALESGALTVHTERETYLRNGTFDPDGMVEFLDDTIEEAVAEYEGLRIAAEMTWVFGDEPDVADLIEYESKVNDLFPDTDSVALCQYNRDRFPPEVIRDVIRTHPHLVFDEQVCHNVYYTPPEEFLGDEQTAYDIDRMLGTLRDRAEADAALEEHEQHLRKLHEITADSERTFDQKLDALLELGCDYFDLDLGMLTREHEDSFEIERMHGDHPDLDEGTLTPPMTDNYCRQVVSTGDLVSVADAGASGWTEDALYHTFDLECYAGAEIRVDGEVYGTICFTDTTTRDRQFSDSEETFLELMTQWVSYELERERQEDHLTALNRLTRQLMDAETVTEVSRQVVEAAESTLGLPVTAIALHDPETERLRPISQTDPAATLLEHTSVLDGPDSLGYDAFTSGTPAYQSDPLDDDTSMHPPVTEVGVFPLGDHGVFVVGSTAGSGFNATDNDFAETVAANTEAALDRARREQQLHEREQEVQARNETLQRLNRVNDIIRSINQALAQQSTREDIEHAVCERLAESDSYEFAWVGTVDEQTREVVPSTAVNDQGYLDDVTITADDDRTGQGPTGTAIRTSEPKVIRDITDADTYEPWREQARERGFNSSAAIPIVYEDTTYGVLNVYTTRTDAFDEEELTAVSQLGEIMGLAIAVTEREQHLEHERERLEFINRLIRHNLLNSLNVVQARAGILDQYTESEADHHLDVVRERTDEMIGLIETLRSLMQAIVEEEPELEPVDLGATLRSETAQARQMFGEAEFTIEPDPDDVPRVRADDLLGELLENLLVNAVRHNDKETPRVTVDVETDAETVTLSVADNGPGVSDEMKDRIFEEGEKGFESPGTGFGLHLATEIVSTYGGDISVADNDPEGAVFTVTLPRA